MPALSPALIPVQCSICHAKPTAKPMKFLLSNAAQAPMMMTRSVMQNELKKVIPRIELTGQWSVDVMRNGNDYYIIDMALAENSALNDCVPKNLLRAYPQQWLPGESNS